MPKANPKRNRQRGKSFERYEAKQWGVKPQGVLGDADVVTKCYSIECKERNRVSIRKYIDQAVRNTCAGTLPLVVIHELNTLHEDDLYIGLRKDIQTILAFYQEQ